MTESNNYAESKVLWEDLEKNKFYILYNETGKKIQVNSNTDLIKQFDAKLTGQVNFKERVALAKDNQSFMPYKAHSLRYNKKTAFYTPTNDKFVSYAQFPNALANPYFNEDPKLGSKDEKKNIIGTTFLTGTIKDRNELQNGGKLKILTHRQNTQLVEQSKYPDTTKIINHMKLKMPNTTFFESQMKKVSRSSSEQQQIENHHISESTTKYMSKVTSRSNKTKFYQTIDQKQEDMINDYYSKDKDREQNVNQMLQSMSSMRSSTFDKKINLNYPKVGNEYNSFKTSEQMTQRLKKEKQELEGFIVPQKVEQNKIQTKGRFNVTLQNNSNLFSQDRKLMLKVQPQLYTAKEIVKKKKYYIDPITGQTLWG